MYVWRIKTSTRNLACLQRHMHTVRTCRLSQAKTTRHSYIHASGVLLLDALGEDIPDGGRNIPEGSLAVSLSLRIPGPGNINTSVLTDTANRHQL